MKSCTRCKTDDQSLFPLKPNSGGKYWLCRPCNTERFRQIRTNEIRRKAVNSAVYRSAAKNREKVNARSRLNYYVKTGRITKPTTCDSCSMTGRLHGHHDDYSKPLEVLWLCTGCHAKRHEGLGTGYGRKHVTLRTA